MVARSGALDASKNVRRHMSYTAGVANHFIRATIFPFAELSTEATYFWGFFPTSLLLTVLRE